jgi:hypothetical protein
VVKGDAAKIGKEIAKEHVSSNEEETDQAEVKIQGEEVQGQEPNNR